MSKRAAYIGGAIAASVALAGLLPGVAQADPTGVPCYGATYCETFHTTGPIGGEPVAFDGDLSGAPGATLRLTLFVDGRPTCSHTVTDADPAGSWICNGLPDGAGMWLVGESSAPGTIDMGIRTG